MTQTTKISDAGLNVRARNALRRLMGDGYPAGTLADVAAYSRGHVLRQSNTGKRTLDHIRDVLLTAGLRLRDDTPALWEYDRSRITNRFVAIAEKEPGKIVRLLCNQMSVRELVKAAYAMGLDTETKDNGEEGTAQKGDRQEGVAEAGRGQAAYGQAGAQGA